MADSDYDDDGQEYDYDYVQEDDDEAGSAHAHAHDDAAAALADDIKGMLAEARSLKDKGRHVAPVAVEDVIQQYTLFKAALGGASEHDAAMSEVYNIIMTYVRGQEGTKVGAKLAGLMGQSSESSWRERYQSQWQEKILKGSRVRVPGFANPTMADLKPRIRAGKQPQETPFARHFNTDLVQRQAQFGEAQKSKRADRARAKGMATAQQKLVQLAAQTCPPSRCSNGPGLIRLRMGDVCVCYNLYELAEQINKEGFIDKVTGRPYSASQRKKIEAHLAGNDCFGPGKRRYLTGNVHDCQAVPVEGDEAQVGANVLRDVEAVLFDGAAGADASVLAVEARVPGTDQVAYMAVGLNGAVLGIGDNVVGLPFGIFGSLGDPDVVAVRIVSLPEITGITVTSPVDVTPEELALAVDEHNVIYNGQTLTAVSSLNGPVQVTVTKVEPLCAARRPRETGEIPLNIIVSNPGLQAE